MGVVSRLLGSRIRTCNFFFILLKLKKKKICSPGFILLSIKRSSSFSCRPVVSNKHLWCLLNHSSLEPMQIQKMWSGSRELAFPSSQVMLMLLGLGSTVWEPLLSHLVTGSRQREDHCPLHEIKMVKYRKCKKGKTLEKVWETLATEYGAIYLWIFKPEELACLFHFFPPLSVISSLQVDQRQVCIHICRLKLLCCACYGEGILSRYC